MKQMISTFPLKRILAGVLVTIALLTGAIALYLKFLRPEPSYASSAATFTLTLDQLKAYDGTDPSKPIYLAYEGNIYDVTAGKSFYEPGGTYHWLTGIDATKDLNLVGGDIIKRKYPIVGKVVQ